MDLMPTAKFTNEEVSLNDGTLIHAPKFCKNAVRPKCQKFYHSLVKPGMFMCPFGFATHLEEQGYKKTIRTGMRIEGAYDKSKINKKVKNEFSPLIPKESFDSFIGSNKFSNSDSSQHIKILLHDIRRLGTEVKESAKELFHTLGSHKNSDVNYLTNKLKSLADLVSKRLDLFDAVSNIKQLEFGTKRPQSIYKMFEKNAHCLKNYADKKNVRVDLSGSTFALFDFNDHFDLVPFILLENAIKYSPDGRAVKIYFDHVGENLIVKVKSFGPIIDSDEIEKIFRMNYRGKNAEIADGTGIGLAIVKFICDFHGVKVKARPEYNSKYNTKSHDIVSFEFLLEGVKQVDPPQKDMHLMING